MSILEKIIQDAKLVPKTLLYKLRHKMELTETEFEEVYNSNDPYYSYMFAKDVPGVNIAKLENSVLSSPYWSYWFAFIKGANIAKLENAVLSDLYYSYLFARDIPKANIAKLENSVLSYPEYSYYFAKYVPKANIAKLEESIKKDEYWWNKYKNSLVTT